MLESDSQLLVPPTFTEVYREHFAFLFRCARAFGVGPDSVDDVLQDTFLVVHRRLSEFDGKYPRAWLSRILHNTVREHRRRFRRKEQHQGEYVEGEHARHVELDESPESKLLRAEATTELLAILAQLDDDQRAVFVLTELEEMSAPEISEALEVPLNTVYSRLRLARAKFSKAIATRKLSVEEVTA